MRPPSRPLPRQAPETHPGDAIVPLARCRVEPESIHSLFELLMGDLGKGHYHLAVRHFLMLKGCGAKLPPPIERRCDQLLRTSPAPRRQKIESDVRGWLDMLRGWAPGPAAVLDGQPTGS